MRVYIPATFSRLATLHDTGMLPAAGGWGFAATKALHDFFTSGEDEEIEMVAIDEAARAVFRLLQTESDYAPLRRVVIAADLPESQVVPAPEHGEAVVQLSPATVSLDQIACIFIDHEASEPLVEKAIAAIDAADLGDEDAELVVGDALELLMGWYVPAELDDLIATYVTGA
ncbi:DUF6912 family protein [Corynebacterium choanae]|uniref:Uncharacterized protein n=1 Tax=Corynebacterium choanae TaxID=1862358 RepID=A0A3G6J4A0_9CORY|nr:hypothetical protein [Corynebacterium choanae]AZA12921.1 hypothetical protein CCHOA_02520 [Corynebacterium choanae]